MLHKDEIVKGIGKSEERSMVIAAGLRKDRNRRLREFEKRARRGGKYMNDKGYGNGDIDGKGGWRGSRKPGILGKKEK
jgi:hypothetical protein